MGSIVSSRIFDGLLGTHIMEHCLSLIHIFCLLFRKGSTTPLHNESVQKYLGRGFIDERGADDKGEYHVNCL